MDSDVHDGFISASFSWTSRLEQSDWSLRVVTPWKPGAVYHSRGTLHHKPSILKMEAVCCSTTYIISYKGESNENLKYFFSLIIEHIRYTMTSFFYVVSIAFRTSVPALRRCMDTSRKSLLGWECSHSCTTCCTSLSDLKDLPPIASLSGPKTWKSPGVRSGEYGRCGRHSKDRAWIVATAEQAVWGWALSYCNKTPVLRSPCCLDLIAGCRWFLRRSAYVALVTVFPWACSASK